MVQPNIAGYVIGAAHQIIAHRRLNAHFLDWLHVFYFTEKNIKFHSRMPHLQSYDTLVKTNFLKSLPIVFDEKITIHGLVTKIWSN